MKKLFGILLVLITLIFTGCDNNKGPFEIKRENGNKVLYSNGKLAKGMIKNTWHDYNSNETVTVSEYYVNEGVPAGNFNLYDREGNKLVSFEGEVKNGLFIGKMTGVNNTYVNSTNTYKTNSEGEYNLNPDWLLTYDGTEEITAKILYYKVLENGKVYSEREKYNMVNGRPDGRVEEYFEDTGNISKVVIWKNGEETLSTSYGKDGNVEIIDDYVKDENGDYTTIEFYYDGKISISLYRDLAYPAHTNNLLIFNAGEYRKFGYIFDKMTVKEIFDKYSKKYNFKLPENI